MNQATSRFLELWRANFGASIPMAHVLRAAIPQRWARIHSLPESKRYADGPNEMAVVLDRANTVASEVLGEGEPCWIVATIPCGEIRAYKKQWARAVRDPYGLIPVCRWHDDEATYSVRCAGCVWETSRHDALLTQIADDTVDHVIWVSTRTGNAIAPYDGGCDLFLADATEIDPFKRRFADWLSPTPTGL